MDKAQEVLDSTPLKVECIDCPWRHPDTCRECKGGKK